MYDNEEGVWSMKTIILTLIIAATSLIFTACSDVETSDSGKVTLSQQIDSEAKQQPDFPEDATVEETEITIDGQTVSGKDSAQLNNTDKNSIDVTSVKLPSSITGSKAVPEISFTVETWLNGKNHLILDKVTSEQIKTIKAFRINLINGDNYFCIVLTANKVKYRSMVLKVHTTAGLPDSSIIIIQ